ncbi:TetR/AcrR family transcriptional regulator [Flavobacterium sp. RSSA_27]|uniref:TetR/AcrR family transcriptional regulator n=1 Tax=Flavobacterium sp. RSSA_27 TaxID=3447667 RepID=UPI003F3234E1
MKTEVKLPWIELGYTIFANEGPSAIKIEQLARKVGKSKSSFYHHFADTSVFLEELLKYHLKQSQKISILAKACQTITPDFIHLLLQIKTDILFNRQLRVHRDNPVFKECFLSANIPVENAFLQIWTAGIGLESNVKFAKMLLQLTIENFYLQITAANLNEEWLTHYFNEIKTMVAYSDKKQKIDGFV